VIKYIEFYPFAQFSLGDQFTVSLASNPTTGYNWELTKPSALLQVHLNDSRVLEMKYVSMRNNALLPF
jgi:predicted secreted protein